jgi:hypothetical protein
MSIENQGVVRSCTMLTEDHLASIATISFDPLWLARLMVRRNFGEL